MDEKKKGKRKIVIIITIVAVITIILASVFIVKYFANRDTTITCTFANENSVGYIDYTHQYTYDSSGKMIYLEAVQIAKPSDAEVAEYLFMISSNMQTEYNKYEGLTYNCTMSEDGTVTLRFEVDAIKAPKLLDTLTDLDGINAETSKEELISIYEDAGYTCEE